MNPARFLTDRLRGLGQARPALVGVCVGAGVGFATYLAVFMLTRPGLPAWINVSSALFNAGSAMVLAAAVIAILRLQVFGRRFVVQALAHGGLAAAFTYLWYLAVIILNGIRAGSLADGFEVNPFVSAALTWQLFQGVAIYAVAAMGAYVIHVREALIGLRAESAGKPAPGAPSGPPRRVMVRGAEGLVALDFDEVLYVRAAGDGARIVTRTGGHETRKTLTALSETLPPGRFVRAHRSVLVNRDAILSAEPAGDGRLTLHLPAGQSVTTSRSGARAVREATL